ncbi:Cys-tRNA(Pro) deacylase [Aureispira anguillae]|uniref:Cys-tRNA(Pro)/Cys-tRNA(Cys) deacylase n=1 Tax=Aureispira anguillae TaxID=2864201 RepID=A0A915YCD5_9BACT|nr:Cys-tRNA(Pro) deacylase [Aureispira anguillae]BDS10453.1 Cys-tRNA(Pro) deacylase [Aureispira anguillae]
MKKTNAIRLLEQKKIPFDLITYTYNSDNLNVEQIAKDNHLELHQIYKTLVVQGDKTGLLVALVPGNQSLSLKKLAAISGNKKVSMVAVKDLQRHTGYIRGGCSPFGMKKQYATYVSKEAKDLEIMYVNAGVRGLLVGGKPSELCAAIDVEWSELI